MDYNAFGDVTVKANGNEVICRAPVEHKTDTAARIKAENERAALIAELKQRSIHDEKRMANLKRRHSKLLRKHQDNLSYGIKKIWNGLSLPEQYIILKDMDYNLRHND